MGHKIHYWSQPVAESGRRALVSELARGKACHTVKVIYFNLTAAPLNKHMQVILLTCLEHMQRYNWSNCTKHTTYSGETEAVNLEISVSDATNGSKGHN